MLLAVGAAVTLVAATPGLFVDPLCIDKHHEWLRNRRGPMFLAGWAEVRAVFGFGRPRLPEGLPASAYTLETHPPFQRPDLWWLHLISYRRNLQETAEPRAPER
jgi:hypothetical protein